jgi:hypothetical protein
MDHRVAQVPTYPATVAVAYTDRSQEANINAIILSEAFGRCLRDLGQCAQLRHMINADCYSKSKGFVCLLRKALPHSLLSFHSEVTGRPACGLINPQALRNQLMEFLCSNVLNRLPSVQSALLIEAAVQIEA